MAFDSRSSVVDFVNEHGLVPNNETLIPFRFASPQLKAHVFLYVHRGLLKLLSGVMKH